MILCNVNISLFKYISPKIRGLCLNYSYLRAFAGFSLAALIAGKNPETAPIRRENNRHHSIRDIGNIGCNELYPAAAAAKPPE